MENLKSAETLDARGLTSINSCLVVVGELGKWNRRRANGDADHHARMLTIKGLHKKGVNRLYRNVTEVFFAEFITTQVVYYDEP